jgi:hypothetical protein
MTEYLTQDKTFINSLRIGDIFVSLGHSYIYYLGIDTNRKSVGKGEYMFYSLSTYNGDSIIYYYTEQGTCISLMKFAKISRDALCKEIVSNMIKTTLLNSTKLPEDVINYTIHFTPFQC